MDKQEILDKLAEALKLVTDEKEFQSYFSEMGFPAPENIYHHEARKAIILQDCIERILVSSRGRS